MEGIRICGGRPLRGSIQVPGAKNAVLPVLAASILCRGPVTLENVPNLSDVAAAARILQALGGRVSQPAPGRLRVLPPEQPGRAVPRRLMQAMRSSLFFLAPVLSRTGQVQVSLPGGCDLGARPIDMHLHGLAAMGARFAQDGQALLASAPGGLRGADITLRYPSVGATETLLMAAVCARGETMIRGAAIEPEVTDLARFLQAAGACITGVGTRRLRVMGVQMLQGVRWRICPDRIAAATVLCAAAACGGRVALTGAVPDHCTAVVRALCRAGCCVTATETGIALESDGRLRGIGALLTDVYPAFPTDAAPLLAAALLRAEGESAITDTVFENRFACAAGFSALGAVAGILGRTVTIRGVRGLHGAQLAAPDLRGGAALAIGALAAEGESLLTGVEHIDRGYEDLAGLFAGLGADTARVRRREAGAG